MPYFVTKPTQIQGDLFTMPKEISTQEVQTLIEEIQKLRSQVAAQQTEINQLKQQHSADSQTTPVSNRQATRRKALRQFAGALVAGVAGGTALLASQPQAAEAKISFDAQSGTIGAVIVPRGYTIPATFNTGAKFGLLTTNNPNTTEAFAILPLKGSAIYANTKDGEAVTAFAETGRAINAWSIHSTGVVATSSYERAIIATTYKGVPLSITPNVEPPEGQRQIGDMYVDDNGKLYVWANDDTQDVARWRKVQFAS